MAADAITAGTIAAGAIGASEAPLLANLDAAVTSRASAANLTTAQTDITTLVGYGAPPSAVAIGVAVWATAHGTPSINTFGWLTWRHAQWGTEIADKAIVGQDLVLRSPDLATTYATVRLRDKDGNVIAPAVGEPARFDPT
jgi:ABC-type proline/glycine betaine transport system substrate-binding protein